MKFEMCPKCAKAVVPKEVIIKTLFGDELKEFRCPYCGTLIYSVNIPAP